MVVQSLKPLARRESELGKALGGFIDAYASAQRAVDATIDAIRTERTRLGSDEVTREAVVAGQPLVENLVDESGKRSDAIADLNDAIDNYLDGSPAR